MDDIQDRIAWNSALNNAVNMVKQSDGINSPNPVATRMIEEWQLWFYQNLTNRKKPEPKKIPMTGKEVAMLSKTMESEKVKKHFDVRDVIE